MSESDRLRVTQRPLAERERADLQRQAQQSERLMLVHWTRALHRWSLIGCAALVLLAALWWATARWGLDARLSAVLAIGGGLAFIAMSSWELYEARSRVAAVQQTYAELIREASAKPVYEIEVRPVRVWGSPEDGWMFDVAGGRALFADWDLPEGAATERIVASVSPPGGMWLDQSGEEMTAEPLPYLWENLRDDHPLLELVGAVTFRLEDDPGAALRDFVDHEWIIPPEARKPEE